MCKPHWLRSSAITRKFRGRELPFRKVGCVVSFYWDFLIGWSLIISLLRSLWNIWQFEGDAWKLMRWIDDNSLQLEPIPAYEWAALFKAVQTETKWASTCSFSTAVVLWMVALLNWRNQQSGSFGFAWQWHNPQRLMQCRLILCFPDLHLIESFFSDLQVDSVGRIAASRHHLRMWLALLCRRSRFLQLRLPGTHLVAAMVVDIDGPDKAKTNKR